MLNRKSKNAEYISNFSRNKKRNLSQGKKKRKLAFQQIINKGTPRNSLFETWKKKCVANLQKLNNKSLIVENVLKSESFEEMDKTMFDIPYVFMLKNGLVRKNKFEDDWRIQNSIRPIKK